MVHADRLASLLPAFGRVGLFGGASRLRYGSFDSAGAASFYHFRLVKGYLSLQRLVCHGFGGTRHIAVWRGMGRYF